MSDFDRALAYVLQNEGWSFTDDPLDHGGATRFGVTQHTLSEYLGRPATKVEVATLTSHDVAPIYKKLYWDRVGCGRIGLQSMATLVFDCAVLCGCAVSVSLFYQAIHLPMHTAVSDAAELRMSADMPASHRREYERNFVTLYQAHLTHIAVSNPLQRKWIGGWTKRVVRGWRTLTLDGQQRSGAGPA